MLTFPSFYQCMESHRIKSEVLTQLARLARDPHRMLLTLSHPWVAVGPNGPELQQCLAIHVGSEKQSNIWPVKGSAETCPL